MNSTPNKFFGIFECFYNQANTVATKIKKEVHVRETKHALTTNRERQREWKTVQVAGTHSRAWSGLLLVRTVQLWHHQVLCGHKAGQAWVIESTMWARCAPDVTTDLTSGSRFSVVHRKPQMWAISRTNVHFSLRWDRTALKNTEKGMN